MKRFGRLLTVAVAGVLLAGLLSCCGAAKSRSFAVAETYTVLAAKGSETCLEVNLPVSYGYQQVTDLVIEHVDDYELAQHDGYQVLTMLIRGTGESKTVRIGYTVTLGAGTHAWEDTNVLNRYTMAEQWIDCDSAAVKEAAARLVVEGDALATAKKIHNFVVKTLRTDITPKVNAEQAKASEILARGTGVCSDYAILMTALLRAAGIPAREISGLSYKNLTSAQDWSHPADAHAWVEFYAAGAWHFADPTWGRGTFDTPDGYHLSYGTLQGDIRAQATQRRLAELESLKGYKLIGAMTTPFSFWCWTDDENATLTPRAEVTKI